MSVVRFVLRGLSTSIGRSLLAQGTAFLLLSIILTFPPNNTPLHIENKKRPCFSVDKQGPRRFPSGSLLFPCFNCRVYIASRQYYLLTTLCIIHPHLWITPPYGTAFLFELFPIWKQFKSATGFVYKYPRRQLMGTLHFLQINTCYTCLYVL